MKYKWLNKLNNEKLIIFFNGWGMDDIIVSKLEPENYDVVTLYDYNNLDLELELDMYKEKHIIAWSMGVMIATLFDYGAMSATAICGTPCPIHDEYGILHKIYNLTIKGFSETSVEKFMKRMFKTPTNLIKFSNRDLESQKSELIKLMEYKPNEKYNYTRVIIPNKDVIIPTKNQENYWKNTNIKPEIIDSGHCPFGLYTKWAELL